MTYRTALNELSDKPFNCKAFGGRVTVSDGMVYCADGRVLGVDSPQDVVDLYTAWKVEVKK